MTSPCIDINCDLGEDAGNDAELLPLISSVNIACGAHAGSATTMHHLVQRAAAGGIAIGAHPGYFDREHFGRRNLDLPAAEITALLLYQLGAIDACCKAAGATLHHIKLHGALYNQAAVNESLAQTVINAFKAFNRELLVYGLSGSLFLDMARQQGLRTVAEVFADRTYTDEGTLTPRSEPGALITTVAASFDQVVQMISRQAVTSTSGKTIRIHAETICLHGDGEHAVTFARQLHQLLPQKGICIQAP